LRLAKEPEGNPGHLDFPELTLPLVAHDYPAVTPAMWNACYCSMGIDAGSVALVCDPMDLAEVIEVFRQDETYRGGGMGVGLKEEALRCLDRVDGFAQTLGAVNIVVKKADGGLEGYNTDAHGYAVSLSARLRERGLGFDGLKVLLLGAGGTAKGIAMILAERGAQLVVLNRTVERAEALARKVNAFVGRAACSAGGEGDILAEAPRAQVLINASTKGSTGSLGRYVALAEARLPTNREHISLNCRESRIVMSSLAPETIVSDVVLRKGLTPTLALAREFGLTILDGLPMVINQGVEAFWLVHQQELESKGIGKPEVAQVMTLAATAIFD
jgi:shikimate dehydrogenase